MNPIIQPPKGKDNERKRKKPRINTDDGPPRGYLRKPTGKPEKPVFFCSVREEFPWP